MTVRKRLAVSAMTLVLGAAGNVSAQQATGQEQQTRPGGVVRGEVVHAVTRRPLASAQVYVVGFPVGALSNAEGRFTIPGVPPGNQVIRFQSVGYGTTEQPVNVVLGDTASITFEVREQVIEIDQVVVTALGIQRAEKSLGYAVQSVSGAEIERTGELSLVSALAGQTAGTHITQSTGQAGGSARLVIRGEGSFRGDGQPLYVIDGVPLIADIDRQGYDPLERGEAGSRVLDIDPINIEEISILRGAAATVLYGSRAALGAVIIRTKQGTPGTPLRFTLNSRVGHEEPIIDGLQTTWAQGVAGFYCNGKPAAEGWCQPGHPNPDPLANLSWGPHKDSIPSIVTQNEGQLSFRDPREDFYRSGLTSTQSLYITGSIIDAPYGLGFSYANQEGVLRKSRLDRLNMNANLSVNITSRLKSHTTLLFSNTANDWGWEGLQGFTNLVSVLPPTRDLSRATNDDGTPVMFGSDSPHPQWLADNEYATSATTRWIASETFTYRFGPGLVLSNQLGFDTYIDDRREYQNERPWLTASGIPNGGTRQQKITRRTINDDFVLSLEHRPLGEGPFSISGLVGGNIYSSQISDVSGWGTNLAIPGFYQLSNFTTRTVSATLPAYRRLVGMYAQATMDYRDWAFFTLTGRNDWSSTLPTDGNAYFYPSASVAVVFTDALGWSSRLLDYGKVRLSVSKVGSDAPPYRLKSTYLLGNFSDFSSGTNTATVFGFPYRTVRGFVLGDNFGNPNIKPEGTVETEFGIETRLLNGQARADISLYNRRSYDQIFSVPVATSTGFRTVTQNAGDLTNRGIEVSVGATPLQSQSVSWDVQLNYTRNWSNVDELAEGVDFIPLAGFANPEDVYVNGVLVQGQYSLPQVRIMEGYGYGVIFGTSYQRNEQGQLLIGNDGWPIQSLIPTVLGEIQPTWLGNFSSVLRYRGITLSGLLDIRRGGKIFNGDLRHTIPAGTAEATEQRNDRFTWQGVHASTGQPNTVELVRDQAFWTRFASVDENLIESANVIRLREATVSIALPQRVARVFEMQSMSVYASGRNLKVWAPFSYGDPDGSNYGSVNAGGGAYRLFTVPMTRTYSLGVRASF
jgi:TonB-linked SusC/RagA family outer membrane protein